MNNVIKYGLTGEIVSGRSKGWFLRIEETEKGSGSYLILVSKDREFSKYVEGYDYWAENSMEVQDYFDDIKWIVRWLDKG